jgi:hypothetical protein
LKAWAAMVMEVTRNLGKETLKDQQQQKKGEGTS